MKRSSRSIPFPFLASRILRFQLRERSSGQAIAGDLFEEYAALRRRRGRLIAWFWAWTQTLALRITYGGPPQRSHRSKQSWRKQMLDEFAAHLRLALRSVRRDPFFSLVSVVVLSLGIGAATGIASLAEATLFRSPPVRQPDRLAAVYTTCRAGAPRCSSSYPDLLDYRERSTLLEDLAGYSWLPLSIGDEANQTILGTVQTVTGNYFELLGVSAWRGRLIEPGDDLRGSPQSVAVLSYNFWKNRLGGDSGLVGRTLRFNGSPFQVVGIAVPDFRGVDLGSGPDVWIPMFAGPQLNFGSISREGIFDSRGSRWISALVGRMKPEVTVEQVRAEMAVLSDRMAEEFPEERGPRKITVDSAENYNLPPAGREDLVRFVALLVGVVGFTLLLTCANLANLQLTRATAQARETGVRLCLGAGPWRLVRQFLTHSLCLSLAGGILGLLVAGWLLRMLSGFQLPGGVSVADVGASIDGRVFALALVLSLLTGAIFGTAPALFASRLDLMHSLRGDRVASASGGRRLRRFILAAQVALCLVLLLGSGLFLRTLFNGLTSDLGFPPDNLVLARFNLSLLGYNPVQGMRFVEDLKARTEAIPGVESAALATRVPLMVGNAFGYFVQVPGYQPAPDEEMRVEVTYASRDYFRTLGLQVQAGREFQSADVEGAPRVAMVNRTMAAHYWGKGEAVQGRFRLGGNDLEVRGVASDADWEGLDAEPENYIFVPLSQHPDVTSSVFMVLLARTRPGADVMSQLRSVFRDLEPRLAINSLGTMSDEVGRILMAQRMGAFLLTTFGVLAVILASVGIFGVVACTVNEDQHAIGVRLALGAGRARVVRGVIRTAGNAMAGGLIVGVAVSWFLASQADRFLFGVSSHDWVTYASAIGLLTIIGAAAAYLPARRAAALDPQTILKAD